MAKNKIKRCLIAILDPHPSPTDVDLLWTHFAASCAYCGISLTREARHGHLDHAIPSTLGGTNSIYSHVLACARCNGDEKRETHWERFLEQKCQDAAARCERRDRIVAWFAAGGDRSRAIDDDIHRQAQQIIEDALAS